MIKTNDLCKSCKYATDAWCAEKYWGNCDMCERYIGAEPDGCKCLRIKFGMDCADYEPREGELK